MDIYLQAADEIGTHPRRQTPGKLWKLGPNKLLDIPLPEALRRRALNEGIRAEQRVITYLWWGISASMGRLSLFLAGYRTLSL